MKLAEFMVRERDALIEACLRILRHDIPDRSDEELGPHLAQYIAEIAATLRGEPVVPESALFPMADPELVARDRHRRGFRIEQLVPIYTAISRAIGEVGGRDQLAFAAAEYGHFNQTIDKHVAEAIEAFAAETRRAQEDRFGERLGILAHELRNALSTARLAFDIIERGDVAIHGRTADLVRRNLGRMETLIDHTLIAARTGVGNAPPLHAVLVAPLLEEITLAAALERGIRLTADGGESLAVIGDEHLLVSILGNLVQNAIKFSHDDSIVSVRTRPESGIVVIEVEDACGGLPEGQRDDLFKPFVQRSADRRGVGLGLTIARDAVHVLGGEITVKDRPGQGCVFAIHLPSAQSIGAPSG